MFDDRERGPGNGDRVQRTPMPSVVPRRPAPDFSPLFTPAAQARVQVGQRLTEQTLRPVAEQRQAAEVLAALDLQRQALEQWTFQRQALAARVSALESGLPAGAL